MKVKAQNHTLKISKDSKHVKSENDDMICISLTWNYPTTDKPNYESARTYIKKADLIRLAKWVINTHGT